MKNIKNNTLLLAAVTAISLVATTPVVAQSRFSSVYVKDGSGQIVRTGIGGCLHTNEWKNSMFECSPAVVPVVIKFVEKQPKIVKVIIEDTEFFDFDKAELKDTAKTKLLKLIDDIKKPDEVENMRVYGYTDRIGTDEYNMKLSKKRAESVRDFLVEQQQISSNKIEVIPMGKKDPRVSCENLDGNQELLRCLGANRRVEVFLAYDLTVIE